MNPPVVIQAGGQGTRLRPYTAVLPKPLMPVGEMPILEIVVRQLVHHGFNDLYITTGHLSHLIELFFGDGSEWNARITYLREDRPLGTIGPVRRISRPECPFIVMNGDILTDLNYRKFYEHHLQSGALLTVAVYKGEIPVSLGVIKYDQNRTVTGFREKPTLNFWASMGIYIFSPEMWDRIPPDSYYGFDTLMGELLQHGGEAKVYPWEGLWLDIGRPEDYEKASEKLRDYRETILPNFFDVPK